MAQKRRQEKLAKRRQRMITLLCVLGGIGAAALSIAVCAVIFGKPLAPETPATVPAQAELPYTSSEPFSVADLTAAQLSQLREQGRMNVSDGPRGLSVGDSLDTLLERFPASYTGAQPDEEQILYCADYFENQNGVMTVLPPRGLLSVGSGNLVVTLLSPTSAYPPGTLDNSGSFEHVYCQFFIEPDGMTISSIVLGLET